MTKPNWLPPPKKDGTWGRVAANPATPNVPGYAVGGLGDAPLKQIGQALKSARAKSIVASLTWPSSAGSRVPFVGVVIYILRVVEDGASGTLPHLGQAGIVMASEPSASGADDEGEDTERDEEGADNRPDHSPSDAARGKRASSGDKHGPSERPRNSQSCCGALLQLVHESRAHRALFCGIEKTKFLAG